MLIPSKLHQYLPFSFLPTNSMSKPIRAQFLLTEVGHGLDAKNLETTATLLASGDFELHTLTRRAAK